jgi:hypothetical protein
MLTFLININNIQHAVAQNQIIPNSQEQNAQGQSFFLSVWNYIFGNDSEPIGSEINDQPSQIEVESDASPVSPPPVAQTKKLKSPLQNSDTYDFLASCAHNSIDQKINDIAINRLFDSHDNGPYIQTSIARYSNTDIKSNIFHSGVVGYQRAVSQRLHLGAQINIINSSDADSMQSYLASFYGVWFGDNVTFTNKAHFGQVNFSQDNNNWICLLASSLGYNFKFGAHLLTPALEGSYYTTSDHLIDTHNVGVKVIANYKYLSQLNDVSKNNIKIVPGILAGVEFENQYTNRGKINFIFAPNLLVYKNNIHLNLFYQLKKSENFTINSCFVTLKINI